MYDTEAPAMTGGDEQSISINIPIIVGLCRPIYYGKYVILTMFGII